MGVISCKELLAYLEGRLPEDPEQRSRLAKLAAAVEDLKRERWRLYMRLVAPFFCEEPDPGLIEVWRREASESVARRLALADFEEAVAFMLSRVSHA